MPEPTIPPPLTIHITGEKNSIPATGSTDTLDIAATYVVSSTTRDIAETSHDEVLDAQKIVEFTFQDEADSETVWIGDYLTIDEIFPGTSTQLRGLNPGEPTVLVIPSVVYTGEPGRGLFSSIVLKLVRIFTKKAVAVEVKDLAARLEQKQLGNVTGLLKLTSAPGGTTFEPVSAIRPGGNYLLFLHGTISSAEGAFKGLRGSPTWDYITKTFTDGVLAFQHETLTKSPLDNVLDLVNVLPQSATLTLISHSRGGLVGDVLSRYCLADPQHRGFSANEKEFLRKQEPPTAPQPAGAPHRSDLEQIEAIDAAMVGKSITIDRFIRVASTASGTTLLSRRLDTYFNVIMNVLGLATGLEANPVYGAAKDLIAAVLANKDDASVLPGLAVQTPGSPFNQMLNNANPDTLIDTPLIIISGDAKLSLRWQAITVALTKLFFWDQNDFVVDTRSMYNGARWADNKVQYFFDAGPDVSHSSYFTNQRTQNALRAALQTTGDALIPGFARLASRGFTPAEIRSLDSLIPGGRVLPVPPSGKKPIVVLLPGIMGSTLTVNDNLIWINFLRFVSGGLSSLLNSADNNKNVRADGLVGSSYKKLVDYLTHDYDVVVFPFDWRLDMLANAAILDRKLTELLALRQPIKLIGHSMGGVLVRDFIINYPGTWTSLKASQGFRLVFLGAPLGGSFRIPYVLFGQDSLIHTLDFIDITHSQKELLAIFSRFPGILNLLPLTADGAANNFADPDTWSRMQGAFPDTAWPVPGDDLLGQFKTYQAFVLANRIDWSLIPAVYVAGQSRPNQQTISGYTVANDKLTFLATKEGDESVTWASGIPQTMDTKNVYYSTVPHGELANDPTLFGAITDLLATGSTTQLKRTRPVVRSLDQEFTARTIYDFDLSQSGVEKSLLGLVSSATFTTGDAPIQVSVSNGDFKYAQYPLLVGHFEDDGLHNAEKAINDYLKQELSHRHRLGLYPGVIGSSEQVLSDAALGLQGVIIVGLGQPGMLNEYRLTKTIEQSAASYLANLNRSSVNKPATGAGTKRAGLSALLIGSGYGGLRIENTVRAIIQGIQNANTNVRMIYDSPRLIEAVEFVELYKDRALTCIKAIRAIEKDENQSLNILCNGHKIRQFTGWRERLPVDDTTGWWTRIKVVRQTEDAAMTDAQRSALRTRLLFEISTDAARVETRFLTTLNDTLSGMLEDLSKKDDWSPQLAKAIFELMIPNDFKEQVKRQNNINWILDGYTAAFPWELLQDSATNARPLSVNAGMIRQLETGNARINIQPVIESTAIVIADPDLSNWDRAPQLPAAREEGRKIADLLTTQGFEVQSLLGATAAPILQTLFSNDYKIVHLAGHGIFNSDPQQPTGMVIGKDAFLTPAYIDQMSNVPELVFVNCCYLGASDGAADELSQGRFRLAANIGTQLIDIGVKAVVVAGWSVDDSAALDFAERFYTYLFEGYTFGEAVKKARQRVYDNHKGNNTWGAYQAYGDPLYRLTSAARPTTETYDFVTPDEAEIELTNLLNQVESGGYDGNQVNQTMDAIAKAVEQAGVNSGRIIELQALLYAGLTLYDQAVKQFEKLWAYEPATYSFSATEKFCGAKAMNAINQVKKARQQRPADAHTVTLAETLAETQAITALKEVVDDLKQLIQRFGATAERTAILAGTYKRLAYIFNSTDKAKQDAYTCSAANYRKVCDTIAAQAAPTPPTPWQAIYPLVNWVAIESALVQAKVHQWGQKHPHPPLPSLNDVQGKLNAALEDLRRQPDDQRTYEDWIAEAMLLLTKRVLGDSKITDTLIQNQYIEAWQLMGFQTQHTADLDYLEFLADALAMAPPAKAKGKDAPIDVVRKLLMTLAGLM